MRLVTDWLDGIDVSPGEVVLCENVRFNAGEKANDDALAQRMASLCDVFVMDAFGTAHRAQASTHGVAKFAPVACAGPLLAGELNALEQALSETHEETREAQKEHTELSVALAKAREAVRVVLDARVVVCVDPISDHPSKLLHLLARGSFSRLGRWLHKSLDGRNAASSISRGRP